MKTIPSAFAPKTGGDNNGDDERLTVREAAADLLGGIKAGKDAVAPYRRGLAPVTAMAATGVAGEILAGLPGAWMYTAALGGAALGATFAPRVAAPVLHWLKRNTPGVLWARATLVAGAGWLTAAAAAGPDMTSLVAAGVVAGAPWWVKYRQRIELPAAPAPEPEVEQPQLEVPADLIWERVVANGGPLRGTKLEGDWAEFEHGRTCAAWLPDDGRLLVEEAMSCTVRVTLMYRKRIGEVIIEPHTDGIEGHLQVTLLDRNPTESGRAWAGPCLDPLTGIMPLGLFTDGKGEAKIRMFEPGAGMKHILVSGGTGSGKSNLLCNLIASIEHSGVGLTWLADPQGGQSIPDWADGAVLNRVALDMDEIRVMVKAAYDVMMANSEYITNLEWVDHKGRARKGKKCIDPTSEMPFLALVIDEAHKVLADADIAKMVADIAKMGRKAGVILILATQTPTQEELGGAYGGAIRDNVLMGNIIVLRTKSRMTGGMLSLPVDPAKLPAKFANGKSTHGIGFVLGETERPVQMRVDYDDDPFQWTATSPRTKLHAAAEEAARAVFDDPDKALASNNGAAGFAAVVSPLTLVAGPQGPVESESDRRERVLARDAVMAYLEKRGHAMRGRMMADLRLSSTHLHRVLNDLVSEGKLTNDGTGRWAIPGREPVDEPLGA